MCVSIILDFDFGTLQEIAKSLSANGAHADIYINKEQWMNNADEYSLKHPLRAYIKITLVCSPLLEL